MSGVNDAAGAPFWFNGKPTTIYNPAVLSAKGGTTFKRGRLLSSGSSSTPPRPAASPCASREKAAFSYVCLVHPGMKGTVVVQVAWQGPAPQPGPRRLKKEIRKAVQAAIVKEGATVVVAQAGGTTLIQAATTAPVSRSSSTSPTRPAWPVNTAIRVRGFAALGPESHVHLRPSRHRQGPPERAGDQGGARGRFELAPRPCGRAISPCRRSRPRCTATASSTPGSSTPAALGDFATAALLNADAHAHHARHLHAVLPRPSQMTATVEVVK